MIFFFFWLMLKLVCQYRSLGHITCMCSVGNMNAQNKYAEYVKLIIVMIIISGSLEVKR